MARVGDRVRVVGKNLNAPGILRFAGKTLFKPGAWFGVELDRPAGKNDGSVQGVRYFSCAPQHGVFVREGALQVERDVVPDVAYTPSVRPIFSQVATLYAFDKSSSGWLMRGNGTLQLVENEGSGSVRLVMLNLVDSSTMLNHSVHPDLRLERNVASDQAWIMRVAAVDSDWLSPRATAAATAASSAATDAGATAVKGAAANGSGGGDGGGGGGGGRGIEGEKASDSVYAAQFSTPAVATSFKEHHDWARAQMANARTAYQEKQRAAAAQRQQQQEAAAASPGGNGGGSGDGGGGGGGNDDASIRRMRRKLSMMSGSATADGGIDTAALLAAVAAAGGEEAAEEGGSGGKSDDDSSSSADEGKASASAPISTLAASATASAATGVLGTVASRYHGKSVKGYAPYNMKKDNQDSMILTKHRATSSVVMAVFDGHGEYGHFVSRYLRKYVPPTMARDGAFPEDPAGVMARALTSVEAKLIADKSFDTYLSGSTGVMCVLRGSTLDVANIGDSRLILGVSDATGSVVRPEEVTQDHKPDSPAEQARIENKFGGRVFAMVYDDGEPGPARVWLADQNLPGLAMSRSLGDELAKMAGVVSEPEMFRVQLRAHHRYMVLASDGLWEFMSNQEVLDIVARSSTPELAVQRLLTESKKRWMAKEPVVDDTTIIVAFINEDTPQ